MKMRSLVVSGLSVALIAFVAIAAEEGPKLEGIKCAMNPKAPAKAEKFVEFKGGKVFFCCDNCPKKFDAKNEQHAMAGNHQLVASEQTKQEKCPISGAPCKPEHKVTVDGADVAFCCPNCKGKVEKAEGADKLKLVFSNEAFEKAFKVSKK